jgi:hypothetical protein
MVAVLAWAMGGAEGAQATPNPEASVVSPAASPRVGSELREAVREALRRWAKPSDQEAEKAAREFLSLYEELRQDRQLASSQREYLETKVRGRLEQLSDQISLQIALQKRKAQKANSVKLPGDRAEPLGQQMGMMGQSPFGQGGLGGAARADDEGQALVDLIQKTICPTSWDINGGPGSIYYWYPGRAMVIRQTDDVHDQIGGVLEQMRRLGP